MAQYRPRTRAPATRASIWHSRAAGAQPPRERVCDRGGLGIGRRHIKDVMQQTADMPRTFVKMHGLGNDFVVIDARDRALDLDTARIRLIADRHLGVGCDQLIIVRPPEDRAADGFMEIRNPDGSAAEACGNATRCVASMLMRETGRDHVVIQTVAGLLSTKAAADGLVGVDMGPARTGWRDIPLSQEVDTLHLPLARDGLPDAVGTSMGNPHATFFVADAERIDPARLGPSLEHDPLFPERANIGFASISAPGRIRLRMWERGAGITLACGSGACAALVAAARRGLTGRRAEVVLDGGPLSIEWRDDGRVLMTGPVATSFTGTFAPGLLS